MVKDNIPLDYIDEAIHIFEQIMHDPHPRAMDNMNKVSKGEMFVLGFLDKSKDAVMPSEISEAMNSSSARVSAILNSLEKKEQIVRAIDISNRRNVLVTITQSGQDRINSAKDKMRQSLRILFEEMGEADTREFIRLIKRFGSLAHKLL